MPANLTNRVPSVWTGHKYETDYRSGLRALSLLLLDDVIPRRLFSVFVKRAQPWVLGQGAFLLRFDTHGVLGSHVVGGEMVRETRYLLVRNIPEKSTEESINHYFQRWVFAHSFDFVWSHQLRLSLSLCAAKPLAEYVRLRWYKFLGFVLNPFTLVFSQLRWLLLQFRVKIIFSLDLMLVVDLVFCVRSFAVHCDYAKQCSFACQALHIYIFC